MIVSDGTYETKFAQAWDADHLHLIIMPTEKCNFRCVYCYEDFSIGRMKPATIIGLKAFLSVRAISLKSLEINWFGGEPTLASEIIEDVMTHVADLAKRFGFHLLGAMTTNGYLLNGERYLRYVQLGITHFQISLDGYAEFHDETRRLAGKGGTFAEIWSNLLEIKAVISKGEILLRLHLSKRNIVRFAEFRRFVEKTFDKKEFVTRAQLIEDLGGDNDLSEILIANYTYMEIDHLSLAAEVETQNDGYICYAAKANSFVIRADGRIGKCTVALKSLSNTVGRLLDDGTIELDAQKIFPWLEGWTKGDSKALACPASGMRNE